MTKIVLASVLKPVDDTRMYGKLAKTIASIPNSTLHIIGFESKSNVENESNIHFYPVFNFRRLSFQRVFASVIFFQLLFKIKPQTIIITTHELILPSVIYRIFFKTKLIYDVQENYFANIIYTNTFPFGIKHLLANWVRFKELISAPFVNHFILAERCYEVECKSFITKGKSIILENKFAGDLQLKSDVKVGKGFKLVYSGTVASMYGIWEAINLTEKLHEIDDNVSLQIIGYGTDESLINDIKYYINDKPFITLIGGNELVPHKVIIDALKDADLAILSYQFNKSTINKIPTKLFECLALSVPMLLPKYAENWNQITNPYSASICVDFNEFDAEQLYDSIINTNFYFTNPSKEIFSWQGEKLVECVKRLNNLE